MTFNINAHTINYARLHTLHVCEQVVEQLMDFITFDEHSEFGLFHITGVVGCQQNEHFWFFLSTWVVGCQKNDNFGIVSCHRCRGVPKIRKLLDFFSLSSSISKLVPTEDWEDILGTKQGI